MGDYGIRGNFDDRIDGERGHVLGVGGGGGG